MAAVPAARASTITHGGVLSMRAERLEALQQLTASVDAHDFY